MGNNKVVLIQVWIGKIPDYFWYHYESTKNLYGVDFLIFTDQPLKLDANNYKVFHIDIYGLETLLFKKTGRPIRILSNKKVCDLKASYGDLFSEYIQDYEYFGCYDIDTLFGDFNKFVFPLLGQYDIITVGNDVFHNRISGPFCIFRNNETFKKLYDCNEFESCFLHDYVDCFEEGIMNEKVRGNFSVKIINDMNCETDNGGKNSYESYWKGGKLFANNKELFIYHAYRKKTTKFNRIGNIITTNFDKKYLEDFYWVVSFTEDYEHMFLNLLKSMKKYSNRKCIIYGINYDFNLPTQELGSEQFIIRRIDIDKSEKDFKGRDINIITSKPLINLDVINFMPNGKFVCIDSDIYLNTNSDEIVNYFQDLEDYPLINSHVFDSVFLKNIVDGIEWSNPLDILLQEMGLVQKYFPRRKTNIVIFDSRSEWFFKEQMSLYCQYKGTRQGILSLHDEDTANAILNKYGLHKSLPLLDTEDLPYLDFIHISNYNFSPSLQKPKTKNHILFFHGCKTQQYFNDIESNFGNSVLDCEELFITYDNNKLTFEKNSFLTTKTNKNRVHFQIYNLNNDLIFNLASREIRNYFVFYIDSFYLQPGKYLIKIVEEDDDFCIFRDIIEIK